jgi:hypothetical protein
MAGELLLLKVIPSLVAVACDRRAAQVESDGGSVVAGVLSLISAGRPPAGAHRLGGDGGCGVSGLWRRLSPSSKPPVGRAAPSWGTSEAAVCWVSAF